MQGDTNFLSFLLRYAQWVHHYTGSSCFIIGEIDKEIIIKSYVLNMSGTVLIDKRPWNLVPGIYTFIFDEESSTVLGYFEEELSLL